MARTTFRIDFHQPPQVVDQIARNILIADDYREIDYNREVVWKKGTGLMTAMKGNRPYDRHALHQARVPG